MPGRLPASGPLPLHPSAPGAGRRGGEGGKRGGEGCHALALVLQPSSVGISGAAARLGSLCFRQKQTRSGQPDAGLFLGGGTFSIIVSSYYFYIIITNFML